MTKTARGPTRKKSKPTLDVQWVQSVPLEPEAPAAPETPPWIMRCGPPPAWLVLGATLAFPGLGEHLVAGIRPGARTWEAMPALIGGWYEVDELILVAPPAENYRPWPGTSVHLKL